MLEDDVLGAEQLIDGDVRRRLHREPDHIARRARKRLAEPRRDEQRRLLGHTQVTTTQRYAHLQPDAHKAVLGAWERLDAPLTIAA